MLQPVAPQQRPSSIVDYKLVDYKLRELHMHVPRTNQQQEDNRARCALVWTVALHTSVHHLCARLVNDSAFQEVAAASLVTASSEDAWRSLSTSQQEQQLLQRAVEVCCPPPTACATPSDWLLLV